MIFLFNEFNLGTTLPFILICKIPKLFHYPHNCHNPISSNLSRFHHSRVFFKQGCQSPRLYSASGRQMNKYWALLEW